MQDQRALNPESPLFKPKQAAAVERSMRKRNQAATREELFVEHPEYAGHVAITGQDETESMFGEDFDETDAIVAAMDQVRADTGLIRGAGPSYDELTAQSARRARAALNARTQNN